MSEALIFSVGSLLFIATTWATFAFGLRRMHELHLRDLRNAGLVAEVSESGLTEIYVPEEQAEASESDSE